MIDMSAAPPRQVRAPPTAIVHHAPAVIQQNIRPFGARRNNNNTNTTAASTSASSSSASTAAATVTSVCSYNYHHKDIEYRLSDDRISLVTALEYENIATFGNFVSYCL